LIIGICNFDIVCNLSIVIWDFSAISGKVNRVYLNQLELTLTFPSNRRLLSVQKMNAMIISPKLQWFGKNLWETEIRFFSGCDNDGE